MLEIQFKKFRLPSDIPVPIVFPSHCPLSTPGPSATGYGLRATAYLTNGAGLFGRFANTDAGGAKFQTMTSPSSNSRQPRIPSSIFHLSLVPHLRR